LLVLETII